MGVAIAIDPFSGYYNLLERFSGRKSCWRGLRFQHLLLYQIFFSRDEQIQCFTKARAATNIFSNHQRKHILEQASSVRKPMEKSFWRVPKSDIHSHDLICQMPILNQTSTNTFQHWKHFSYLFTSQQTKLWFILGHQHLHTFGVL